jgi:mono/diheme cytochrome c family protein
MRRAILIGIVLGLPSGAPPLLHAQESGDVEAGRRLAMHWCTGCHAVVPNTEEGLFAADFADIAKVPSTTALSLRVFLRSSHRNMPNFILQPQEADDIVAYIISLKHK